MLTDSSKKRIEWLVGVAVFVVTVSVSPQITIDPINVPKLWMLTFFAFGILGTLAITPKVLSTNANLKLLVPLLLLLTSMLLSMFFSGANISKQIFGDYGRNTGLLAYLSFSMIFLGVAIGTSTKFKKPFIFGICSAIFLNVVYGFIQALGKNPQKWNNPYNKVIGTLGNPNFASSFLGIGIAFCFSHLISRNISTRYRILSLVYILFALFNIQKSDAQQGLLVALLGTGVVFYFLLWEKFTKKIISQLYLLLGFLGSLLIVLGMLQKGPLKSFIYTDSVTFRGDYWRAGLKMFSSHLFFGVGPDSFGDWYRATRTVEATIRRGPSIVTNAAHNVFIDIAATAGIFAIAAYLVVIFIGFKSAWNIHKRNKNFDPLYVGVFAAWIGYLAQSTISINNIALGIWGWVLPGTLIAIDRWQTDEKPKQVKSDSTDFTGMTMTIGLVIGGVIGFMPFNSDANYRHAVESSDARLIVAAAEKWPTNTNRLNTATLIMNQNNLQDFEYELAKKSVNFNPRSFDAWFNLYSAGKATQDEKIDALKKMKSLDPHNPDLAKLG